MKAFNIWVTKHCNFKCSYCYEGLEKEIRNLSLDDIDKIVSFIKKEGMNEEYIIVNYHGGEPLINYEAIKKICFGLSKEKKQIYYTLTTNGSLLSESIIEELKGSGVGLSISLDGTEYYHDLNRIDCDNKGTYKKCIKNALLAIKMGMDIRVRMTIVPSNYKGLFENVKHLYDMGFKTVVAVPDFYCSEWNEKSIEDIKNSLISVREWAVDKEFEFVFFEDQIVCKGKCEGGTEECNIDTDLRIYPCTYVVGDEQWCIGNVVEGIDTERIQSIEEISTIDNLECVGCGFVKYCMSTRCKIVNKQITGRFDMVSPVICAFENIIYRVYH